MPTPTEPPPDAEAATTAARLGGIVLFLPVPLVLWLLTRAPMGVPASVAVGIGIMLTHRFYARPFALGRATRRCLWCGGHGSDGLVIAVHEPVGSTRWRACRPEHADALRAVLSWTHHRATRLRLAVLGALVGLVVAGLLADGGWLGPVTYRDVSALFRLAIAATVLPFGLVAGRERRRVDPPRPPFPVHLQALIGTSAVLWLFRLVGLFWLVSGAGHFLRPWL